MTRFAICAALAALGTASASAFAQEQNAVRLGLANLTIHSRAPDLTSNGPAFLTPPASLTVDNAQTLFFGYVRRINEKLDVELAAGIPPAHKVYGTGGLAPYGMISRVKQAGPAVFLNYKFGTDQDKLRPFFGVGLNYTKFFDGRSTDSNNLAAGGPTKIRLTDSVGPALQAGLSYRFDQRWSVNGAIIVADVQSDMTATTGSIERKTHIDFRPIVYTVCIGYHF
ncbi:MAG TPA: OmpW family outer membrane protein [Paucimonas sp.]|nr:OmpW family outer membrane protein [Paucimonas sp.]